MAQHVAGADVATLLSVLLRKASGHVLCRGAVNLTLRASSDSCNRLRCTQQPDLIPCMLLRLEELSNALHPPTAPGSAVLSAFHAASLSSFIESGGASPHIHVRKDHVFEESNLC